MPGLPKHVTFAESNDVYEFDDDELVPPTPSPSHSVPSLPSSPAVATPPSLQKPMRPLPPTSGPTAINFKLGYSPTPSFIYDVSLHTSSIRLNNGPSRSPSLIPESILNENATYPPLGELVIIAPLPWKITIKARPGCCVTVLDVLEQLYLRLRTPVTQAEYAQEGDNSRRAISGAFHTRINGNKEEMKKGLKRVDFLKGRNTFLGLVSTKEGPHVWRLDLR